MFVFNLMHFIYEYIKAWLLLYCFMKIDFFELTANEIYDVDVAVHYVNIIAHLCVGLQIFLRSSYFVADLCIVSLLCRGCTVVSVVSSCNLTGRN